MKYIILFISLVATFEINADLKTSLDKELIPLMKKVVDWRHDIHQYPELLQIVCQQLLH